MFGQIKENILHGLELVKNNPEQLKAKFAAFTSTLKESKDLSTFYGLYDLVENASFENAEIAKEFLDECLTAFNKLDKSKVAKLKALVEGENVNVSIKAKALDQLLFNENLNIKEKFDQKSLLIKTLTDNKDKKVDYKEMLKSLDKKVTTQMGKLTNEQKEALNLFLENDNSKVQTYYNTLLESTIEAIENKILETKNVEENIKYIEVKKELQRLKTAKPNIDAVDNVIDLKSSLS